MNSGCCSGSGLLPVSEALERILTAIIPVTGRERLPLKGAVRRVLAEPIDAPDNIPPFTNSAMDGWAVRAADVAEASPLRVTGTSWAGQPFEGEVTRNTCVRIFTGAALPAGGDAVIPQEDADVGPETMTPRRGDISVGTNLRYAGDDVPAGTRVLESGQRLDPSQIALLAAIGIPEVTVFRRPRVAFLTTGDELRPLGTTLGPGQIYDSNRYALHAMLSRLPVEIMDMGVVPDDPDQTRRTLGDAAAVADLVVSTGGVSVGEADYVTDALDTLGEVNFWKMAMKPGRPLAFGHVGQAWFFGLPGNPVSCMATFYQFVQPALRKLMGEAEWTPVRVRAPAATQLRKVPGRTEFQRGILDERDGERVVRPTGGQGSHLVTSMSRGNCFVILPAEWGDVPAGTLVEVEPFDGLV